MAEETKLFCRGGGCTAKLGPAALERILGKLERGTDPDLLVGFDHSDDAAVYRLSRDLAAVQTLDFFPPMVEDPRLYGQIAAANALSDIYAMGGEVKMALNIVCFPETMDLNVLGKILEGGNDKVKESGGILAGGHSIADDSVKYGLSVFGTVHPDRILTNCACREGDALLLTKPLGVGIVCTAARMGAASDRAFELAVESMRTLNRKSAEIFRKYRIHACTDVTGFGFLGHLCEMMGDRTSAEIDWKAVPWIPDCEAYIEEFYLTAAAQRNRNHVESRVEFRTDSFTAEEILYDPQTSGGLLAGLDPADAEDALRDLEQLGLPCAIVGRVTEKREKTVTVR